MFYLNLLLSCHGHHSSLNSLNMSLKKDHLTILNPASVSGIDYVRVLPPPSARIQVHLRVIHSITNNTLPVPNSSCLDRERWCCTKFVVYKNNAMNGQGSVLQSSNFGTFQV